jgi:TRAP-type C4-dicarboxylate transport system permease small subunit
MKFFELLDREKTKLLEILNSLACFWIFILVILIAIDVFGRILFNVPFKGTPELVSNSLIAITFLEIPFVLNRNQHVRTTIFLDRVKPVTREIAETIAFVIGIAMFVLLIISSWHDLIKAIEIGEFEGEGALRVPTYPTRAIIVFGSCLMIIEYIFKVIKKFIRIKKIVNNEKVEKEMEGEE